MEARRKAGGGQQVIPMDRTENLTLEHRPRGDGELAEQKWKKKEQLDKTRGSKTASVAGAETGREEVRVGREGQSAQCLGGLWEDLGSK